MEGDQPRWSGKLIWSRGGSEVYATVQATDSIRDPCVHFLTGLLIVRNLLCLCRGTSNWPAALQLGIVEAGISILDVQAWAQKYKTPVARVECLPGMDSHHFDELVEILRRGRCVSHRDAPSNLSSHALAGRSCTVGDRGPRQRLSQVGPCSRAA
jgi:hypothetical protein